MCLVCTNLHVDEEHRKTACEGFTLKDRLFVRLSNQLLRKSISIRVCTFFVSRDFEIRYPVIWLKQAPIIES